ncbi:hypothetical protein HaLaN_04355 [Haematococcus lacustris]|uniref:Uncharacterized protein n=1 Tax=Haematococcus lacustris TaxID=44745 RepID=A0A699YN88_HAELA|nr:hypothetical protein HaLaN_04355 [Haematococcus lacustris]
MEALTRASFWSWAAPLLMFVYIISPLDLIPG